MAKQLSFPNQQSSQQSGNESWNKPPENMLKCNYIDAAVFEGTSYFGYGCIVRNSNGIVIDAMQGILNGRYSPILAEAMGIREALSWVKSKNLSHVIIESDALLVIDALNNQEPDFSCLGLIVEDCKTLARDIPSCIFIFAKRSANQAAHALVRGAVSVSGLVGWIAPPPTLISSDLV